MTREDYLLSQIISRNDPSFSALLMTLIRKADSDNRTIISRHWHAIYSEFWERYNAPGGYLPGEVVAAEGHTEKRDND